jgi:phospholipase C
VDGALSADRRSFQVHFAAGNKLFGNRAAGAPFHAYAPTKAGWARSYAVAAGDRISDDWLLTDFEGGVYHLYLQGPNGFYREFHGAADDPMLEVALKTTSHAELRLANHDPKHPMAISLVDLTYGASPRIVNLGPSVEGDAGASIILDLAGSFGWHDIRIRVESFPNFEQRLAGRIDPCMGRA